MFVSIFETKINKRDRYRSPLFSVLVRWSRLHSPSPPRNLFSMKSGRGKQPASRKRSQPASQSAQTHRLHSAIRQLVLSQVKGVLRGRKMTQRRNIHCMRYRTRVAITDCGEASISSCAHNRCPVPHFPSLAVVAQSVCSAAVGSSLEMGGIGEALGGTWNGLTTSRTSRSEYVLNKTLSGVTVRNISPFAVSWFKKTFKCTWTLLFLFKCY